MGKLAVKLVLHYGYFYVKWEIASLESNRGRDLIPLERDTKGWDSTEAGVVAEGSWLD